MKESLGLSQKSTYGARSIVEGQSNDLVSRKSRKANGEEEH